MGTRADFYVGRGECAEWLGSVAWDGYPEGITPQHSAWPAGESLLDATTEAEYRERLEQYLLQRGDVTRPADGWPWPWETSATTDYAYAFDAGQVWGSCFGREWFPANAPEPTDDDDDGPRATPKSAVFPDMSRRMNVTWGARSGLIVLGI